MKPNTFDICMHRSLLFLIHLPLPTNLVEIKGESCWEAATLERTRAIGGWGGVMVKRRREERAVGFVL